MRRFLLILAVCSCLFAGCNNKKTAAEPAGPLEPTGSELVTLKAFNLTPESPKGQRKIRELRVMRKKVEEARANAEAWAEKSRNAKANK